MCMENKGLWKEILNSKYGSWRNLSEYNKVKHASWWWKDLSKVCGEG